MRQPVGRGLERVAQEVAHRQLQVDLIRRNRRLEPLAVEGVDFPLGDGPVQFAVHEFLEGRVVLAQHDGKRFDRQRVAGQRVFVRVFARCPERGEQDVVHHEGVGLAGFEECEGFVVILPEHQVGAQSVVLVEVVEEGFAAGPWW